MPRWRVDFIAVGALSADSGDEGPGTRSHNLCDQVYQDQRQLTVNEGGNDTPTIRPPTNIGGQ
jgi:hypothetical protein